MTWTCLTEMREKMKVWKLFDDLNDTKSLTKHGSFHSSVKYTNIDASINR